MKIGLEKRLQQEDWGNAGWDANNLSQLELVLGRVSASVGYARKSVIYADKDWNAFLKEAFRTTLADALHQYGRAEESRNTGI
ncbi:MAG: hypothetical protein GY757_30610 [bacterium]|nr:hypothetical protein [bacterium]